MADSIDWTDETLRPLDELARLAFPDGGVTAKTLKMRAGQGKLAVYRPGKAYLASLSGVRLMIEKTRVHPAAKRASRPMPVVPNSLGLTEMDLSNRALDRALEAKLTRPAKEAKRLRDDQSGDNLYYMGFLFTLTSLSAPTNVVVFQWPCGIAATQRWP